MRRPSGALWALSLVLLSACAEPPHKEMNQAQGAIDAARAAGAEQYAATEFAAATDALSRSQQAVAQNDYRLALNHAIDGRERAQHAAKVAGETRAKARGNAERVVAETNSLLTQAKAELDEEALAKLRRRQGTEFSQRLQAAEKTMQEARAALEGDDYGRATAVATELAARIQAVIADFEKATAPPPPRKRR